MRRIPIATAVLVVVGVAAACGTGDQPKPALLTGQAITGSLSPTKGFHPKPIGPCDVESHTVLVDVRATDFRAWDRVVHGHREHLVVGRWPLSQEAAEKQLADLAHATVACDRSSRSDGYLVQGADNGEPGRPEWAGGLSVFRLHDGRLLDATRFYTWTNGYMVTAWGQSADTNRTYGDLRKIMDAQLKEVSSGG